MATQTYGTYKKLPEITLNFNNTPNAIKDIIEAISVLSIIIFKVYFSKALV